MERGRPTKFKEQYAQDLLSYFDTAPYIEKTKQVVSYGAVIEIAFNEANDFPTIAGFAISIGVHRDTLLEWSNAKDEKGDLKYPEFSGAYKQAIQFQERYLVVNGLKGLVNSPFAIFTAKNVLGWRDKQPGEEDKVIVNNINDKSEAELNARLDELRKKDEAK